ncbi:polysaccharide pyruvyl transferase family protein [Microbacterium ulmi]|uniref:Polysaccharide pyruvyl transferase family protein n=1 Tax=Microbacterium ulmi TaxID=179095 RepID=A0A7Y2M1Y9_9MICO|nr:polysaccharide pyruvyl transferase family protein [Microbacterium ulmi]NII70161.1 hypothetical protein [Microbacterium ulmi]NNH04299.1 polysaccharide pyruvyl transferase family protein [Microbacterium ulmi]
MNGTLVVTRHYIRNYGSALQAFATQQLLQQSGNTPIFLDYREVSADLEDTPAGYSAPRPGPRGWARGLAYHLYRQRDARLRGEVFEKFIVHRLQLTTRTYRTYNDLVEDGVLASQALAYCVGSDQVWNAEYNVDNRAYFLNFSPPESTRFSLSSSIGTRRFPSRIESSLVERLRTFSGISVRESDAADYLTGFGLNVLHHVDPTLGLSARDWRAFAAKPRVPGPYVLVYQLNASREMDLAARAVGRELGLPVHRIEYWKTFRGQGARKIMRPSVEEFVGLIDDAAFVITDSFHGCAFSASLARPFAAVLPPRYGSRISSLLTLLGLQHRRVESAQAAHDLVRSEPRLSVLDDVLERERVALREYVGRFSPPAERRVTIAR